jgi:hypothetical protein
MTDVQNVIAETQSGKNNAYARVAISIAERIIQEFNGLLCIENSGANINGTSYHADTVLKCCDPKAYSAAVIEFAEVIIGQRLNDEIISNVKQIASHSVDEYGDSSGN